MEKKKMEGGKKDVWWINRKNKDGFKEMKREGRINRKKDDGWEKQRRINDRNKEGWI